MIVLVRFGKPLAEKRCCLALAVLPFDIRCLGDFPRVYGRLIGV